MPSERRRRRNHRDSGAVGVETALVAILLITILTGIVEASLLLTDWLTVSAAARAGARMGSSEPRLSTFAQDSADQVANAVSGQTPANIQLVWIYKSTSATGLPPANCDSASSCVPFTWNGTSLAPTPTAAATNNWLSSSQNACAGDSARDALGVYVKYKHTGMGFFFKNAIVSESTVMWIEPTFALSCKPGGG